MKKKLPEDGEKMSKNGGRRIKNIYDRRIKSGKHMQFRQNSDWARTWKSNFKWHQVPSSSYFAVRHQTLCRSPSNECNICYKIRIKCHKMSAIQSRIGHNIPLDNQTHRCWPGFRREQLMFYDLRIPSAGVETFVKSLMSFGPGMQLFTLSAIHCSSY